MHILHHSQVEQHLRTGVGVGCVRTGPRPQHVCSQPAPCSRSSSDGTPPAPPRASPDWPWCQPVREGAVEVSTAEYCAFVCMHVCLVFVYVYTYVCMYVCSPHSHTHADTHTFTHTFTQIHHTHTYTHSHAHTHTHTHTLTAPLSLRSGLHMYACMCVCTYAHPTFTHMQTHPHPHPPTPTLTAPLSLRSGSSSTLASFVGRGVPTNRASWDACRWEGQGGVWQGCGGEGVKRGKEG